MKIKKITINNFKSIEYTSFEMDDFICFIGQNSNGKSNILKAIDLFFNPCSKPSCFDMFFNRKQEDIRIEICFDNLSKKEKSILESFEFDIADNYFNLSWVIPVKEKDEKFIIETPEYRTKFIDNDEEKKIQSKIMKEITLILPEIHYAEALCTIEKDIKADEKEKSLFSRVTNIIRKEYDDKATKELVDAFINFKKTAESETGDNIASLSQVENGLEKFLKEWNATADIRMILPDIENLLKANISIKINDGIKTPVEEKGHGFQRALLFAMLRYLAELNNEHWKDKEDTRIKSDIFIFEEPEMYLHPQMCKYTYETLKELSKTSQVLLCTHSAHFIDLEDYKSISIVKKDKDKGTKVFQVLEDIFSNEETNKKLSEFKMVNFFNSDRNELFFAKKIILVEGNTEKTALSLMMDKLKKPKHEISIIDCNGKNNVLTYARIINEFNLNYSIIIDYDDPTKRKEKLISLQHEEQEIENLLSLIDEDDLQKEQALVIAKKYLEEIIKDKTEAVEGFKQTFEQTEVIKAFCKENNKGLFICKDNFEKQMNIKGKGKKDYNVYNKIKDANLEHIQKEHPGLIELTKQACDLYSVYQEEILTTTI